MPRGKGKKQVVEEVEDEEREKEIEGEEAYVDAKTSKNKMYSQANSRDISIRGLDIYYNKTVNILIYQ